MSGSSQLHTDAILLNSMGTFTEAASTHTHMYTQTHRHIIKILMITGSLRCLHWLKAIFINSEDPSSIPGPHMVE